MNPNLIGEAIDFLHSKGMESLASRIARKMISPSLASTPHQSGRSTPFSSRSTLGGKPSTKSFHRLHSAGPHSLMAHSQVLERRSTQKSVVFETLTSTPTTKRMLENISQGLEANRRSRSATGPEPQPPRQTLAVPTTGGTGGISFGELRQALQDAVAEQKTSIPASIDEASKPSQNDRRLLTVEKDDRRSKDVMEAESAVDILVDNRYRFQTFQVLSCVHIHSLIIRI